MEQLYSIANKVSTYVLVELARKSVRRLYTNERCEKHLELGVIWF